jgi:class 3 adenylate cyclase
MEDTSAVDSKRTLAAILITDAEGFSSLASRDEAKALEQLQSDMETMRECCSRFNGRIIKSTGDGFLMRFDSSVEAVRCAIDVQAAMSVRTGEGLFRHRIGVHLGDVLVTQDDAYGDGVNVASRLQSAASAGSVWISQTVFDTIRGKLPCRCAYEGEKHFKGLANKIPVWSVGPGEGVVGGPKPHVRPWTMIATPAVLVVAIGLAVYSTNLRNAAARDVQKAGEERQMISELLQTVDGGGAMRDYNFNRMRNAIDRGPGEGGGHPKEVAMLEGLETWRGWVQSGLGKATKKNPVKVVVETPKGKAPAKVWSEKPGIVTVSNGTEVHDFKFEELDPDTLVSLSASLATAEPSARREMIAKNVKNFQVLYAHPRFAKAPVAARLQFIPKPTDKAEIDKRVKEIQTLVKTSMETMPPDPPEGEMDVPEKTVIGDVGKTTGGE